MKYRLRTIVPLIVILVLLGGIYYFNNIKNRSYSASDLLGKLSYYPNQTFRGDWIFDGSTIWIATPFNLIRYDYETNDKQIYVEKDGLLPNPVGGIFKRGNEIWVASPRYGVSILNTQNNKWRYVTTKDGLVSDINLSMEYQDDVVQFTTFEGGSTYDFKKEKWTTDTNREPPSPFVQVNHDNPKFPGRDLYAGWYWRIIDQPTAGYLTPVLSGVNESGSPERFVPLAKYNAGCMEGGPVQNVGSISLHYYDGAVWVGCDQGIVRYNVTNNKAEYLEIIKDYPGNILDVYDANGDDLFVQTSLGLGIVNPVSGSWTPFRYNGSPAFAEHLVTRTLWQDDMLEYMTVALGYGSQDPNPTWWRYNFKNNSFSKIGIPARVKQSLEADGPRSLLENYPPSNNWQFSDGPIRKSGIKSSSYTELPASIVDSREQAATFANFKVFNTWETINAYRRTIGDEADIGLQNKKEYKRFGLLLSDTRENKIYRLYRNDGLHDVYSALISSEDAAWLIGNAGLLKIEPNPEDRD